MVYIFLLKIAIANILECIKSLLEIIKKYIKKRYIFKNIEYTNIEHERGG